MAARLARRFYGRLLSSADAGVVEGALPDDVWALLIGAYGHARGGRFSAARELIVRATRGDAPGLAFLIAGRLLYVCRDHGEALEAFDEAGRREPRLSGRALAERARHAARLGWAPEARQAIETLRMKEPRQVRWHVEALRLSSRAEDFLAALEHANAALSLEPLAAAIHMERAFILAKLGRGPEAVASAEEALTGEALTNASMPYLLEAARIGMEIGDYPMARRHLLRARQERPGDVRPATELARIALFASDVDGANRAIEALSTSASAHPAVRRTHAAIDVLRARHEAAAAALEGVIRDDPTDSEAFTWLAEARLRLGRWDGVYDALHRATMTSNGYLLPAWILRSLAHMLSGDDGDNRFRPRRFEALLWSMDSLFEGGRAELESRDKSRITAALERGLSTLGGNRTPYSSKLVDGRLTGLLPGTSPRHASRRALQLIRSADPERVFAALDEVVQRFPTSSLPVAHRGELALWLGDLKRARADLERAIEIDEGTRWAWIGLTGIETLEGHPDKALEVSARGVQVMKGTVGASVYAYRADAYAALGRFDEAIADLETSARLSKTRLGATVALASLLDMRGDAERAAEIFDQLVDEAPGLLSDAARDEGIVLFETRRPNPTADERQRVMRRALALLGGNRSSSCVTYRTSKGVLRMVPGPSGSRPHRGADEDDLARVRTLLLRATG